MFNYSELCRGKKQSNTLKSIVKVNIEFDNKFNGTCGPLWVYLWRNGLVVKAPDSQSRCPRFKSTGWCLG